jgi:AAA ATPase domain
VLLDREFERTQIAHVLDAADQGLSAVLVLRGEPGVGKTTLLRHAIESAGDFLVARVAGIESEAELGFGALHQVLRPFLRRLDSLPAPQRQALDTALGRDHAGPRDRFLVGLATLTLLADAATAQPLLCIVDDAQWLDHESAGVLAFVARRLGVDAIAMIFAVQDPADRHVALEGLPELVVGGLPPDEARQLLVSSAPGPLGNGISDRIVTQTGGNPLALIELARELTSGQRSGQAPLPAPLPVGPSLQARFLRRVRRLPAATQTLLLAVAADPTGDPALLWRAGELLGFGIADAAPAEGQELVTFGPPVGFRHPLIR